MDKYLRPSRFDCDPNASGADKQYKHWLKTFQNFVCTLRVETNQTSAPSQEGASATTTLDELKLNTLVNYEYIADSVTYDEAITALTKIYVKPVNEIYARYKLSSCRQSEGDTIDTFIQNLHSLSKDCNFQAVSAEQHRQEAVRGAFISGIRSQEIRQKLLENDAASMAEVFKQARTLHTAHLNAAQYSNASTYTSCAMNQQDSSNRRGSNESLLQDESFEAISAAARANSANQAESCGYCGFPSHQKRNQCPANKYKCKLCKKVGHWERVCRSAENRQPEHAPRNNTVASVWPTLATTQHSSNSSSENTGPLGFCKIKIKNKKVEALIDSGSLSCSFIHKDVAKRLKLNIVPSNGEGVTLADKSQSKIDGMCMVNIKMKDRR